MQNATAIEKSRRELTVVLKQEVDVDSLPVPTGDPLPPLQRDHNLVGALGVLRGLNRDTEALSKSLDLEIASFPWEPGDGTDERRDSIERIKHLSASACTAALKAVRAGDRMAREARR